MCDVCERVREGRESEREYTKHVHTLVKSVSEARRGQPAKGSADR